MAKYYIDTKIDSNITSEQLYYTIHVYKNDDKQKFEALPLTEISPVTSDYQTKQHETVDVPAKYKKSVFIMEVMLYKRLSSGHFVKVTKKPIMASYILGEIASGENLTTVKSKRNQHTNICYFESTAKTAQSLDNVANTSLLKITCNERIFITPEHPVGDPLDPFEKSIIEQSLAARLAGRYGPLNTSIYPNQGRSSLCGPAVFFYCLLKDRKDLYKLVVKELWETGQTQIGTLEIEVGDDARRPTDFFYTNKDFSKKELDKYSFLIGTTKVPPIDWITLAGLRDSENDWLDYESPSNKTAGVTMWGKLEEWFLALGAEKCLDNISVTSSMSLKELCAVNEKIDGKNHIIALIAAKILQGGEGMFKNHWIVWEDKLRLADGTAVTEHTPLSAEVQLVLFSWGGVRMHLKPKLTLKEFLKCSFGVMIFSKIP